MKTIPKFAKHHLTKVAAIVALGVSAGASAQTEYTASESWTVGPGDYILGDGVPGCGGHVFDPINSAAEVLSGAETGGVFGALGAVLNTTMQSARPQIAGFAGQVLDRIYGSDRYANCVPVSVVIPTSAQIERIEFVASDGSGSRPCEIGQDCQIGWSRFDAPVYTRAGSSILVTSVFRNWSADRTRSVTMTVHFIS